MTPLLVFASTFVSVFTLGLQSINVNQGRYFAAAATSFFISTGHIWLYKTMPNPDGWDYIGYYLGGITGITASIWFHKVARVKWPLFMAWLRARGRPRDEHADVANCGLHRDFTKGDRK
jgi:hypothetical protein